MKNIIILGFIILSLNSHSALNNSNSEKLQAIKNINRLIFASCNKHYSKQPLWQDIMIKSPDLFIWAGDSIYPESDDLEVIFAAYKIQNQVEDYVTFKSQTPVIGTWDDHDYGKNNGGGENPKKKLSQHYALDFLEEPLNSPRRSQEGIYTSYNIGEKDKIVKIILLDNRYFKDDVKGSLLGETQWRWLENEIETSQASLHLIVSGISVLTPKTIHSEEWTDYPQEKLRLRKILKSSGKPYLYLTGDRHFSSIFRKGDELEFLSSGMTHNAPAVLRPWLRTLYPNPVFEHNYGLIDFSWRDFSPVLTLSIRTEKGQELNLKKVIWQMGQWKNI